MLILVAIAIALTVYLLWERRHLYRLSWQLNGPIALPLVGNGLSIVHPKSMFVNFLLEKSSKTTRFIEVTFSRVIALS